MERVFNSIKDCCGCALCEYVCPQNAITMKSSDGFKYPEINGERCIDCGLCAKKCPFTKEKKSGGNCIEAFAVKHKSEDVIRNSSSGGIFTALSDYVLSQNGYIIGADFDEKMNVLHTVADTETKRDRMRGSKYIQSDTSGIYKKLEEILKTEMPVLFTGTPCQAAAARTAFPDCDNLYIVDIICHGVPSPDVWKKYVRFIEEKYNKTLSFYSFRNKELSGWRQYSAKLTFTDGTTLLHNDITGSFIELFRYDLCMRESCTDCPFASPHRQGDITIGDFWGIEDIIPEISDNKGISAVMVNTEKGREIFGRLSDAIEKYPCRAEDIAKKQPNLIRPSSHSDKAKGFNEDLKALSFSDVLKKYTRVGVKRKLIDSVKTILHK